MRGLRWLKYYLSSKSIKTIEVLPQPCEKPRLHKRELDRVIASAVRGKEGGDRGIISIVRERSSGQGIILAARATWRPRHYLGPRPRERKSTQGQEHRGEDLGTPLPLDESRDVCQTFVEALRANSSADLLHEMEAMSIQISLLQRVVSNMPIVSPKPVAWIWIPKLRAYKGA
ncbi:hypothetical protein Pfo_020508 [Paulownia fortunei]|nr:hypothetical protein Pfo_020508 [Paulownia fortunei]